MILQTLSGVSTPPLCLCDTFYITSTTPIDVVPIWYHPVLSGNYRSYYLLFMVNMTYPKSIKYVHYPTQIQQSPPPPPLLHTLDSMLSLLRDGILPRICVSRHAPSDWTSHAASHAPSHDPLLSIFLLRFSFPHQATYSSLSPLSCSALCTVCCRVFPGEICLMTFTTGFSLPSIPVYLEFHASSSVFDVLFASVANLDSGHSKSFICLTHSFLNDSFFHLHACTIMLLLSIPSTSMPFTTTSSLTLINHSRHWFLHPWPSPFRINLQANIQFFWSPKSFFSLADICFASGWWRRLFELRRICLREGSFDVSSYLFCRGWGSNWVCSLFSVSRASR